MEILGCDLKMVRQVGLEIGEALAIRISLKISHSGRAVLSGSQPASGRSHAAVYSPAAYRQAQGDQSEQACSFWVEKGKQAFDNGGIEAK